MDFFIIENGQQVGPLTIAQLAERKISAETLVWREGMPDWQPAWKVDELRYILNENNGVPPTPPTPPVPPVNAEGTAGTGNSEQQMGNVNASNSRVDESNGNKPKSKLVWKLVGVAILLLLIIMSLTNPSKETHEEKIRMEVSKAIDKSTTGESNDIFSQGFKMVARMITGNVLDTALDQLFEYHNYIIYSKGTITLDDKEHTVSYGIFGKVITMNADDMMNALEKDEPNVDNSENESQNNDESASQDNSENASQDNGDTNTDDDADLQSKIEKKADKAVDRIVDKASKKMEDKINKKLDEVTDSTTIEKLIDKILSLF